jgi:hypothetical protein
MVSNKHGIFTWTLPAILIAAVLLPTGATAQLNQPLHQDGWILAAAHAPGAHNAIWRTDLWVHLTGNTDTSILLYLNTAGTDNSDTLGFTIPVTPGTNVIHLPDVIETYLHVGNGAWTGGIHYFLQSPGMVWARIYSTSPDGKQSFGQFVEGIPSSDYTPDNDPWYYYQSQFLYGVQHSADNRFRVNVGIVNPSDVESTYIVDMYDATGNYNLPGLPATFSVTVPPFSMIQVPDPFATVNWGNWNDVSIRVICDTDGGGAFAYASVVDNATNDAYFVRGIKQMSPSQTCR